MLALPWMESVRTLADESGESDHSMRFACLYFSNGVEPEHWWAKGSGADMEIGRGLLAMKDLREETIFLSGLFNEKAWRHESPHMGRMANLLSGATVSSDPNIIRVGRSFDQLMASQFSGRCDIPCLTLGIEPTELRLEDGLSMLYGSTISWASETKPVTKEIYPAKVLDRIIGRTTKRNIGRSVLDEVLEDSRMLRLRISRADRRKLDEYTGSIRDIETRIDRATADGRLEGQTQAPIATMDRPHDSLPQDVPEHMRLMMDLIAMSFQLGKTRIATCMLNNDLSQMNFGFLEGVQGSLHLDLTHNGRDPELEAMYLQTNRFHIGQFAYLIDRLKKIDEGGQSLLHNSLLMCCSNLFDGDKHQADRLPIVLAGQAGGSLKTGRILDYLDRPEDERRACSLYLSVMDRMGVSLPGFGDADRLLADL